MKASSLLAALVICTVSSPALAATNRLAIYLAADEIPFDALLYSNLDAKTVRLWPEPAVADADFVAYDRTNLTFEITLKAAYRLAEQTRQQMADWQAKLFEQLRQQGAHWPPNPMEQRRRGEGPLPTLTRDQLLDFFMMGMQDTPFVLAVSGKPLYLGVFQTPVSSAAYNRLPGMMCPDCAGDTTNRGANVRLRIGTRLSEDPRIQHALRRLRLLKDGNDEAIH